MKNKKGILSIIIPLFIISSLFVVFYSKIECKPNHAGFWFIFALGMSVGVVLTQLNQFFKDKNKQD